MRPYLFLIGLGIFLVPAFGQKMDFRLAYPVASYLEGYREITSGDETVFGGLGLSADMILKYDDKKPFLKINARIISYQSLDNLGNSFFEMGLAAYGGYSFGASFYGGLGFSWHNYSYVPTSEFRQTSASANIGGYVYESLFVDLVYDHMLSNNIMKNMGLFSLSLGYDF